MVREIWNSISYIFIFLLFENTPLASMCCINALISACGLAHGAINHHPPLSFQLSISCENHSPFVFYPKKSTDSLSPHFHFMWYNEMKVVRRVTVKDFPVPLFLSKAMLSNTRRFPSRLPFPGRRIPCSLHSPVPWAFVSLGPKSGHGRGRGSCQPCTDIGHGCAWGLLHREGMWCPDSLSPTFLRAEIVGQWPRSVIITWLPLWPVSAGNPVPILLSSSHSLLW